MIRYVWQLFLKVVEHTSTRLEMLCLLLESWDSLVYKELSFLYFLREVIDHLVQQLVKLMHFNIGCCFHNLEGL